MKLEQYNSLSEKASIFGNKYKRIDSCEAFDKWFSGNHGKYFRGINEARFKNYTSAQRLYMTHELHIHNIHIADLVKKQVESLKKARNGLICTYFKSLLGYEPSDLLLLSFAQHQKNGIAPLLDFSFDRRIALFFMADGCDFSKCGSNRDSINSSVSIEDYASLYYLTGRNKLTLEKVIDAELHTQFQKLRTKYADKLNTIPSNGNNTSISRFINYQLKLQERHLKEKFIKGLLSTSIKDLILESSSDDNSLLPQIMIANLNITAQQGCFIYHNDNLKPFEDLYCVDIHKSLIPYIRNHYIMLNSSKANGLSSCWIYPDPSAIVEESINDALSEIVKH